MTTSENQFNNQLEIIAVHKPLSNPDDEVIGRYARTLTSLQTIYQREKEKLEVCRILLSLILRFQSPPSLGKAFFLGVHDLFDGYGANVVVTCRMFSNIRQPSSGASAKKVRQLPANRW